MLRTPSLRQLAAVLTLTALLACPKPQSTPDAGEDAGAIIPLALTGLSPDHGPSTGGTELTLTGNGFEAGVTVKIGEGLLTELQVVGPTTLTGKTAATSPGAYDVIVSRGSEVVALPQAYTFTCRIDDDCSTLGAGMRCEEGAGRCVAAKGCNDDTNCPSANPDDYCYTYGLGCRCVNETNETGFPGVCRRRRGVCDECTADDQCGSNSAVFDPVGKCVALQGDSSGKKYCAQAAAPTCGCGMVNVNGYCQPQSGSCNDVGCDEDKDCPGGSVCNKQQCLCEPRCRWDFALGAEAPPGCPPGKTCWVDHQNLDPASLFFGAGRCRAACTSDTDCTDTSTNPFGGPKLKCASEKLAGGAESAKRCRANGECMDNLECPELPIESAYLGYCDRASFACKTDCRVGIDPVTGQGFKDCRNAYKCVAGSSGNTCELQTCAEQGGARIACHRGQYCCGEDKNGDGAADPCPPASELGPDNCYDAPVPPFCTTCENSDDCAAVALPAWMTGAGACTNGSKSPSCSTLPMLCMNAGSRPDGTEGVNVCAPSTYNDNTPDSFGVGKALRGCPAGYSAVGVRPQVVQGDAYCNTNADCSIGHNNGICDFDQSQMLPDGGHPKACLCTTPGLPGECPNSTDGGITSVCKFGIATPTVCLQSVVCMPSPGVVYEPAGDPTFGCGL